MIKMFVVVGVIMLIVWILKQPSVKGKFGELFVALCLKFGLDSKVYWVLNNVMIPDNDGGTTQIDHIVLSPFGIFVIETKNMKGWIFGDRNADQWTQQIFKCKNQFQNPFRQNHKHIMCLAELTELPEETFTHIIAFVGDCEIKTREKLPDALVTGGSSMISFIKSFSDEKIDTDMLESIRDCIIAGKLDNTLKNKRAHVTHVKKIIIEKEQPAELVCPKCGSPMIRRQAKSGANAGNHFWGCSSYPKCKSIIND